MRDLKKSSISTFIWIIFIRVLSRFFPFFFFIVIVEVEHSLRWLWCDVFLIKIFFNNCLRISWQMTLIWALNQNILCILRKFSDVDHNNPWPTYHRWFYDQRLHNMMWCFVQKQSKTTLYIVSIHITFHYLRGVHLFKMT